MSEPTNYDLVQDAKILAHDNILSNAAEPPTGDQYSYPVVGQAISTSMWGHLTKAWGSGVISYGGAPYRLGNVNDVSNTVTIYMADDEGRESGAVLEGFTHRMTDNITLAVPAVSAVTDYVIGLQYDPARTESPIELAVFTRPLNTTSGRKYIPLWEGRRNPSTVLSSVNWQTARSRIAPTTTVSRARFLPDPRHSGLMWGTLCWTYRDRQWFQLQWATESGGEMVWKKIDSHEWEQVGYGNSYVYPGHGSAKAISRQGDRRVLRGRWERASGASWTPTSTGYLLWNLAPEDRPPSEERRVVSGFNLANPAWGVVNISAANGEVRFHPATTTAWVDIGEIGYTVAG